MDELISHVARQIDHLHSTNIMQKMQRDCRIAVK